MIDKQDLEKMPFGIVFASGEIIDSPNGLNLCRTGKMLRWVAVRGHGPNDWAIYAHLAEQSIEWIVKHGDKVYSPENIKKLVNCDNEALSFYRE